MAGEQGAPVMLGGIPIYAPPSAIAWSFQMKTSEQFTIAGKVIQVLGTTLDDITVTGVFGRGDRSKGETESWQTQERFRKQVKAWSTKAATKSGYVPIDFSYAPRNWHFKVFVKGISETRQSVTEINPSYQLTLFPVDGGAADLVTQIQDAYLARLMTGVGWKQSDYNGPMTQAFVDATLAGKLPSDYIIEGLDNAAKGIGVLPDDGTTTTTGPG